MRCSPRAAVLAATGVLAGAVAAGGCGASSTVDPVAQAAQVTQQAGGAHIALVERIGSSSLSATITGTGFINEQQRAGQLTMDLSGVPGASAAGIGHTAQFIFAGTAFYVQIPGLASKLPGGKSWIKIDLGKVALPGGSNLSQLSQLGGFDPSALLSYLRGSGQVTTVGTDTVRGVQTTHYKATIDLGKVADKLPASDRARVQAGIQSLEKSSGLKSLPVDVWIDSEHRVRRIAFNMSVGSATAAAVTVSATVDLFDYGTTPPIVPPPASQVFDLSGLAGGALNGLGAQATA